MKRSLGFSLLEVLISVVVLAVGLLGIAALQLNMIRYNHSGHLRSVATTQADSMIDRMRANYAGVEAGNYNAVSGTPNAPSCLSSCTPAEIAQMDTYQWNSANSTLLPRGQGTVTNNGGNYTITVRWDNERNGVTGTNCSGNYSVDLACVVVEVQL